MTALRRQSGNMSHERTFLLVFAVPFCGLIIKRIWEAERFNDAAAGLWIVATLAVLILGAKQAKLLWTPAGVCFYVVIAMAAVPLSLHTQLRWAVALIAAGSALAGMIAGIRYTAWFSTQVLPQYEHAPLPRYFDQRFNLAHQLLVFITCVALAGLVLLITMAALAWLPVPAAAAPWLAPLLGLPLALLALGVIHREENQLSRLAVVLTIAGYLAAAGLARLFRVELCGPYGDGEWPLIWYSVFVPLMTTGAPLLLVVQAKRIVPSNESGESTPQIRD